MIGALPGPGTLASAFAFVVFILFESTPTVSKFGTEILERVFEKTSKRLLLYFSE